MPVTRTCIYGNGNPPRPAGTEGDDELTGESERDTVASCAVVSAIVLWFVL